jgi:trehalose 6-phosphate phosphatase
MDRVPPLAGDNCLFLDLDGTLLHLRDDPATIPADPPLLELLDACSSRLDGALAIISGRPIAELDICFAPLRFAAAGIHGAERRGAGGTTAGESGGDARLRGVAERWARAIQDMPMTQLEDKGASLALHWRRAPRYAPALRELATAALRGLGAGFRLLEGNCVIELLPLGVDKGDAVRAFLNEPPFQGRRPVYVGDDTTDIPGFAAARHAGGHGIAVGQRVTADYHFADVDAVRGWLGDPA